MANKILVDYILAAVRNGAGIDNLKQEILGKGYPPQDVEEAAAEANIELARRKKSGSNKLVLFIAVIAAVVIVSVIAAVILNLRSAGQVPEEQGNESEKTVVSFDSIIATDSESLRFHLLNKDIRWVSTAAACEATVADDASRCDIIVDPSSRKWCTDEYEDYKLIVEGVVKVSKGDCTAFKEKPEGMLDDVLCNKISQKSCEGLSGQQEIFCKAALEEPARCRELEDDPECLRNFALSRAYILENPELCEVQGLSISQIEACKGIVRRDCQDIFNRLSTDLSRIDYIKREGSEDKCSSVATKQLQSACSDTSLDYIGVYNML